MQIGPYRSEGELGSGGMAEILRARATGSTTAGVAAGTLVAIKLLHRHLADQVELVALFHREQQVSAGLSYRHLADQLDHGDHQGRPYLVSELVTGRSLRQLLDTPRPGDRPAFTTTEALALTAAAARALAYLQGQLSERAGGPVILHRDLTPANLLLDHRGRLRLIDFGLALNLAEAGPERQPRGTWAYMAPEQIRGEALDERADLFSLGALLYELLSGRAAFGGDTPVISMRRAEQADYAPLPALPSKLSQLLAALLSRSKDGRPPHAGVVLGQLEALTSGPEVSVSEAALAALLPDPVAS